MRTSETDVISAFRFFPAPFPLNVAGEGKVPGATLSVMDPPRPTRLLPGAVPTPAALILAATPPALAAAAARASAASQSPVRRCAGSRNRHRDPALPLRRKTSAVYRSMALPNPVATVRRCPVVSLRQPTMMHCSHATPSAGRLLHTPLALCRAQHSTAQHRKHPLLRWESCSCMLSVVDAQVHNYSALLKIAHNIGPGTGGMRF